MSGSFLRTALDGRVEVLELVVSELFDDFSEKGEGGMGRCAVGRGLEEGLESGELAGVSSSLRLSHPTTRLHSLTHSS